MTEIVKQNVVARENFDADMKDSKAKKVFYTNCNGNCVINEWWACKLHEGLLAFTKKDATVRKICDGFASQFQRV